LREPAAPLLIAEDRIRDLFDERPEQAKEGGKRLRQIEPVERIEQTLSQAGKQISDTLVQLVEQGDVDQLIR
jgi:hypothetical protein